MKTNLIFFFIFLLTQTFFTQSLTDGRASQFIEAMINNNDSLEKFVLDEELTLSKRLGIIYEGIKNKFLISYEIPEEILNEINNRKDEYKINIEKIEKQYSILYFEVPAKNYKTQYYFKNEYLVSPPYFYYRDWQKIESEHFIFYVSEPKYFNQYCVDKLENFVNGIFSLLKFTDEEKELLKRKKLIYILCRDEDEIEKLTGYKARGIGNLAYDYIITTYNCHYHELLHILINFKLKKLPLYTHPFLQEGFAVALGGRGGSEPGIILNLGKFLEQSGLLKINQLSNADEYKTYDVSMSYPLSGLYNFFLINEIGIENYLKLYRKYSSENIIGSSINQDELPSEVSWNAFVNNYTNAQIIKIDFSDDDFNTIAKDSNCTIKENCELYQFEINDDILILTPEREEGYVSKKFNELYPDKNYYGEKYLIRVNDNEAAVYNLFTNNLIANYVSGFSVSMRAVPKENGFYKFAVQKEIFNDGFKSWIIKTNEGK
ncbi:MAG: hypothetical protein OQJ93_00040 [Ignavibacteriaceae bacterium]|nr:hypothetical protein [Ignavibacteriaceae bacterium]MCW8814348.1 hypothetical protein [Chlorobium sp.]MCW8817494.1 hypothetical protein [Ignavibacteriaceae bacterium]MCW8961520.1 hypothetical protein [Ignavibacteriaceae bacterium]MCW9095538.1 hypothetical protein [Ignavibacteriaceae bacterium]